MAEVKPVRLHEEYLRRNMMHAKSLGARAGLTAAQERLLRMKRPPKWLVAALAGAADRLAPIPHEIAKWRDASPDAPDYANPTPSGGD